MIEDELMALAGMKQVTIDLPAKRLTFSYMAPATMAIIKAKMEGIGYPMGEDLGIYPSKPKRHKIVEFFCSTGKLAHALGSPAPP